MDGRLSHLNGFGKTSKKEQVQCLGISSIGSVLAVGVAKGNDGDDFRVVIDWRSVWDME